MNFTDNPLNNQLFKLNARFLKNAIPGFTMTFFQIFGLTTFHCQMVGMGPMHYLTIDISVISAGFNPAFRLSSDQVQQNCLIMYA